MTESTELEPREALEVDVCIVGGGPGGLACAIQLARRAKAAGETLSIALIEKGAAVGDHAISGAVMDPAGLDALVPGWREMDPPIEGPVTGEGMLHLTARRRFRLPWVPKTLRHDNGVLVSLGRLTPWLAGIAEAEGVDLFAGFPGAQLLFGGNNGGIGEGSGVRGVRTGDKGIDRTGQKRPNYEPGVDIRARVTVLADGARGNLTKQAVARFGLDAGRNPQIYATGVKEVWKLPAGRFPQGAVYHTLGWPLDLRTFGGGFLYGMGGGLLSIGLVVGLDSPDPRLDPHGLFSRFKTHPWIAGLLQGGEIVSYGAKAIPEGGWWSIPKPFADGLVLVGDAAGLVNVPRLKGIHLAIASGMLAADTVHEALRANDTTGRALAAYASRLEASPAGRELYASRNFRQPYQKGLIVGTFHFGLQMLTKGRGLRERYGAAADYQEKDRIGPPTTMPAGPPEPRREIAPVDGRMVFDRVTDVYHSGTKHEENQPSHLIVHDTEICRTRCASEYGNPCQYFCPAAVYEMVPGREGTGRQLQINFANCVHCKTCDILDPYQIITWTTPEGGGGPRYRNL